MVSLVRAGLGVALVPGLAKLHAGTDVKLLQLEDTPPGFRIGLALATLHGQRSALAEHFRTLALKRFQPEGVR